MKGRKQKSMRINVALIDAICVQQSWSKKEFYEKVGLGRNTLARHLSGGDIRLSSINQIAVVAEELGIDPLELIIYE